MHPVSAPASSPKTKLSRPLPPLSPPGAVCAVLQGGKSAAAGRSAPPLPSRCPPPHFPEAPAEQRKAEVPLWPVPVPPWRVAEGTRGAGRGGGAAPGRALRGGRAADNGGGRGLQLGPDHERGEQHRGRQRAHRALLLPPGEPCRAVPCRAWLTGPSVGRGQPGGSRGVPEPWEGAGSGGLRAGAACVPQPYSVLRGPRAVCCAASRQLFSPLLQLKRSTERSARVWVLQVPDHLPRP